MAPVLRTVQATGRAAFYAAFEKRPRPLDFAGSHEKAYKTYPAKPGTTVTKRFGWR